MEIFLVLKINNLKNNKIIFYEFFFFNIKILSKKI
jgi:hypothetical protein